MRMRDRYRMEYVNAEVSIIIDEEDKEELTAETLCHRLNYETRMHNKYKKECLRFHKTLIEAINAERTEMGSNILKQLADKLDIDY